MTTFQYYVNGSTGLPGQHEEAVDIPGLPGYRVHRDGAVFSMRVFPPKALTYRKTTRPRSYSVQTKYGSVRVYQLLLTMFGRAAAGEWESARIGECDVDCELDGVQA